MRRLQLPVVLFLFSFHAAAQGCPPIAMQMAAGTWAFNVASAPTYKVSASAYSVLMADLHNNQLEDTVVLANGSPATVTVYAAQSSGTAGSPVTVLTMAGGGNLAAAAADLNGDGNLDLAVTSSGRDSITVLLGNGDGTFRDPITVSTGTAPAGIAAADFNGDGKADLAVAASGEVSVHWGNGDGTFEAPERIPTPGLLSSITAADVNKDGRPDLVAADSADGVVLVVLNRGDGFASSTVSGYAVPAGAREVYMAGCARDGDSNLESDASHQGALLAARSVDSVTVPAQTSAGLFSASPAYPITGGSGSLPESLAVADFNGDGKPDAIAGSLTPQTIEGGVTVLLGNGDGTFTPQNVPSSLGSDSLGTGDFNGDGKVDFASTDPSGISIYLGNGDGTFQSPTGIPTSSQGITGLSVGDFNGDGKLDFAVVDSAGGTSSNGYVYLGLGNGTFEVHQSFIVGSAPVGTQAIDVNGDGKLDLVVTNNGTPAYISSSDPGSVAVLLGNGDGTFQEPVAYAAGENPQFTLVKDINGDGKPDLITATTLNFSSSSYGLSVLLNMGNGRFGSPQAVTSAYGPVEIGAADFNGDGKIDLLVTHCCGETQLGYFQGNGDGSFQPEVLLSSGQSEVNVVVADWNGDGKPDAMYTMVGPYAVALTNTSGVVTGGGNTPVTVQTNPEGLQFTVDGGTAQTAPATVSLTQGSHTIAVATTQQGAAGTQDVFTSWSDGGAASHSITVGAGAATYTASFSVQYLLAITAAPASGGSIAANPGSNRGYYNPGTTVQLTAVPAAGYQLSYWAGDLSGSANPQSLTMNGPHSVSAAFSSNSGSCSITLSPGLTTLPPTGTSTVEACPNSSGQPNCGVAPEAPVAFTVTPTAGCGAWTATSSNPEFLQIVTGAGGSGAGSVSYSLLNNTHNLAQPYSITVASGAASASYTVTESGSGDNQVYREVYALYEQLLGRDPDPTGFAFWTGSGGAGLGQMADSFLTSPEAFNSDFLIMATYQATTGAAPTFAQFTAAAANLRAGRQTATGLFNSLINGSYTASTLYQDLLNRQPTGSEVNQANGAGLANWFQTLIGYPGSVTPVSTPNNEFQSTGTYTTDHTNSLYVQMLYFMILSRDPDPSGLSFWLGVANSGGPGILFQGGAGFATRIQILGPGTPNQGFIGSTEFQGLFAN